MTLKQLEKEINKQQTRMQDYQMAETVDYRNIQLIGASDFAWALKVALKTGDISEIGHMVNQIMQKDKTAV